MRRSEFERNDLPGSSRESAQMYREIAVRRHGGGIGKLLRKRCERKLKSIEPMIIAAGHRAEIQPDRLLKTEMSANDPVRVATLYIAGQNQNTSNIREQGFG